MSSSIDERVVRMEFENEKFEKNIKESMKTLDEFKKSLNFDSIAKSVDKFEAIANKLDLSGMKQSVETIANRFTNLGIVGVTALQNIADKAIRAGKDIFYKFGKPITSGFQEYETQINAVQTILSNTRAKGTTLDQVNAALDQLNEYADKTIYNFTEMTRNIGTFTAAGVDLDTSVSAIKGIANLAAISGSNSEQASRAMYQLSQALSSGTVKLMDWNSVVNAGMGGEVFKNAIMETARVHGIAIDDMIREEGSFRETLSKGWLSSEILLETLNKFTGDMSESQLMAIGYTQEQAKAIREMGDDAYNAATRVKTITQLFDTLAEAQQSGWTQSWEIMIGDFEEARELLTRISNTLGDIIGKQAAARNAVLEQVFGTRTAGKPIEKSKWEVFSKGYENADAFKDKIIEVARAHGIAIDEMIESEGSFEETLKNGWLNSEIIKEAMGNTEAASEAQAKSLEEYQRIVAEIWNGNWGNGEDRFNRLAEAGYDYAFVQQLVNLAGEDGVFTWDELTEEQKALINTLSESNNEFQDLADSLQDSDSAINDLLEGTEGLTGREKIIEGFASIWNYLVTIFQKVKEEWDGLFPDESVSILTTLIDKFYEWATNLNASYDVTNRIRHIFNGLFSIIYIVGHTIGSVVEGFKNFFSQLPKSNEVPKLFLFFENVARFISTIRANMAKDNVFETISQSITDFLTGVMNFVNMVKDTVTSLFSGEGLDFQWLDTLRRWFSKIWDTIKKINFEPFNEFINNAKEFFKNRGFNFEWVGSVKQNVSTALESIGESFSNWAEENGLDTSGPLEFIQSALSNFWTWLTNLDWGPFEGLKTNLSDFWTWLTTNVSNIGKTIFDGIQNAVDGIVSWFKEQDKGENKSPIETVKEKFTSFITWFVELKDTVGSKIEEVRNKVFAGITGAISYFVDWVTKKREQLGSLFDVTDKIQAFIEWFKTTGKTVKSKAASIKDTIFAGVAAAIDKFVEWKDEKSNALTGLLEQFNPIQSLVDWFTDLASKAGTKIEEVKDTVFGGITTAIELFVQWKDQKKKQLTDLLKDFNPIQRFLNWFNNLTDADNIAAKATKIKETVFGGIVNAIDVLDKWKKDKATFLSELMDDFHPIQDFLDWFNGLKDNAAATIEDVKDTVFGGIINAIDKLVEWKDTTKTNVENLIATFHPIEDFINWFNETAANVGGKVESVKDTIFKGVTDAIDAIIAWYNDLANQDAFAPLVEIKDSLMTFVDWFRGRSNENSKSEEKTNIFDIIMQAFSDFTKWGDTITSSLSFIDDLKTKISDFLSFIRDPFSAIAAGVEEHLTGRTRGSGSGLARSAKGALKGSTGLGLVSSMGAPTQFTKIPAQIEQELSGSDSLDDFVYENTIFYKVQQMFDEFINWFNSPEHDFQPITTVKDKFSELVEYISTLNWPEVDIEGMKQFFGGIGEGVASFFVGLSDVLADAAMVDKFHQMMDNISTIFSADGGISMISETTSAIEASLGDFGEQAGEFVHSFMSGLQEFAGDVHLQDVMSWLISALWGLAAFATAGGIGAIVESTQGITEWFEGITGGARAVMLGQIGTGLLGIAAAAYVFDQLKDPGEAMKNVAIALGELLAADIIKTLTTAKFGMVSLHLGSVGTALMGLATAAKIFSTMTEDELKRCGTMVRSLVGELALIGFLSSSMNFGLDKGGGKYTVSKGKFSFSSGVGLIGVAVAVAIIAQVAEDLSAIPAGGLVLGEFRVVLFGAIIAALAAVVGKFQLNIGAGFAAMGLAIAVDIMAETVTKINRADMDAGTWGKLVGLTALVSAFGLLNGVGSFTKEDGTGKKWTISRVNMSSGIGTAIQEMGLAEAVSIMVDVCNKIHNSTINDDDLGKLAIFSGIVVGMGIVSGLNTSTTSVTLSEGNWTKGTGGSGKKGKAVQGPGFKGNVSAALREFALIGAVKIMVDIAKEIHNAKLEDRDVQIVGLFSLIVAGFASLAGDGGTFWVKEKNGAGLSEKTKNFKTGSSIRSMLATMELVAAVGIMGEVAAALAKVDAENGEGALLKGIVAVGAFSVIVALMSSLMTTNIGGAKNAKSIGQTVTSGASMLGTMVALGEAFPKIAQGVTMLSAIDNWDPIWQGLVLLGLSLGELVAAGTLTSLGNVAVGVLIVSAAITAIGFAIAANINAITNFASEFRALYTSLDPEAQEGEGSLEGFFSFIEEFLGLLETYAETFGERGYNIAHNFVDGMINGFKLQLSKLGFTIGKSVTNILNQLGAYKYLAPDMQEMMDFYNQLNWDEYEWAVQHGWDQSSGIRYQDWAATWYNQQDAAAAEAAAAEEAANLAKIQEQAQLTEAAIAQVFWIANKDFYNGNAKKYSELTEDEAAAFNHITEMLYQNVENFEDVEKNVDTILAEFASLYGLNFADIKAMYNKYIWDHQEEVANSFEEVQTGATAAEAAINLYDEALSDMEADAFANGQQTAVAGIEAAGEAIEDSVAKLDGLDSYTSDESSYSPITFGTAFEDEVDALLEQSRQKFDTITSAAQQTGEDTKTALNEARANAEQAMGEVFGEFNFDALTSSITFDDASKEKLQEFLTNYFLPEDFDWSDTDAILALGSNVLDTMAAIFSDPANFDWSALGINVDPTVLSEGFSGAVQLVTDEFGNLSLVQVAKDVTDGLVTGLEEGQSAITGAGSDLAQAALDGATDTFDTGSPSKEMIKIGGFVTDGLRIGISLGALKLTLAMRKLANSVINQTRKMGEDMVLALREYDNAWKEVGKNAIKGFVKGMVENNSDVIDAAKKVAKDTLDAAKRELQIQSPSRAFEEIGMYADMGLVNGLTKYSYLVSDASTSVADESINSLRNTLTNMAAVINGEVELNPTISPVLDLTGLKSSSARIGSMFASRSGRLALQTNGYFSAAQALQNAKVDARNSDVVSAINDLNGRIDAQAEALSGLQVVMNTGALVGQLKRPLDRRLGEMAGYRERGI